MAKTRSVGLASGTIADKYSKISGLSATLWANRVRTAAISGKTSAAFSDLINELRGGDRSLAEKKYAGDQTGTGLGKEIVLPVGWPSEQQLADKVQEMISASETKGVIAATEPLDILLPVSVMNMIPLQSREELGYAVARYLAKARLALLDAAFPGAAGLLFKIAEHEKDSSGVSHAEQAEVIDRK